MLKLTFEAASGHISSASLIILKYLIYLFTVHKKAKIAIFYSNIYIFCYYETI